MKCHEKKAYPTKAIAKMKAALCKKERGVELSAYKCKCCGYWHITSQSTVLLDCITEVA